MTLHLYCSRWWEIGYPLSGLFLNFQKGCIYGAVSSLLPAEPIIGGKPGYQWYTCYVKFSKGFTLILSPDPRY